MSITECRSCGSGNLAIVFDLGLQHLSDFRQDDSKPPQYPLTGYMCEDCTLVQLSETVDRSLMYHDGYGYRSGVNEQIRNNLKHLVELALQYNRDPKSWLDIASNDGTLLSFVPKTVNRVGVDPVLKFQEEATGKGDLFIGDFFPTKLLDPELKYDVVTSISMFYDLDDPNSFVREISKVLHPKGIWVVQQNYLLDMIVNNSFDNICHEHLEYYSLHSMQHLVVKYGFEIIEARRDPINGGSLITIIAKKGDYEVDRSVSELLELETEFGISTKEIFIRFSNSIDRVADELKSLLEKITKENKSIYIYGASTRGAVIWQKAKIDEKLIKFAVERQVEKFGKYFSAIGVPIISEEVMRQEPPDYLLVGPWFLRESFVAREKQFLLDGGKMIFPLPEVTIEQL